MSGDDGFLSRWAKRKEGVRKEELRQEQLQPAKDAAPADDASAAQQEPAFDLASLPSIDSLTASSDITMFLQKGVPSALRNAALRMAWVSDPAIRDYVGPADFQWDFNMPGAITGYGELAAGTDVAGMMADITESHLKQLVEVAGNPAAAAAPDATPEEAQPALAPSDSPMQTQAVAATDDDPDAPQLPLPPPRRRHGGATPR